MKTKDARTFAGRWLAIAVGAVAMVAFAGFGAVAAHAAAPTTLYVSQGGLDSGTCPSMSPCATVSYALMNAPSGATIKVSGMIDDHVTISSPVTIATWAGHSPAVLDGTANGTVIYNSAAGVTLKDLTIENGFGSSHAGGVDNASTMTITDSTIAGNNGGISNYGTMTITDSTISGNTGDGIDSWSTTTTVIASTISGNTGSGIAAGYASSIATLGATIVASNTAANCSPRTSFYSLGYNLTNDTNGAACGFTAATDRVNKNPLLGPLAKNGGPTDTMLPSINSPADDKIPNPTTLSGVKVCPSTDQRGHARPGLGESGCTIGAVEVGFKSLTTTSVTLIPTTVSAGTRVAYLVAVTPQSGNGTPTGTISFTTGTTSLCKAVLSGGVAACGATTATVGTDTVTGTYSGGGGFAGSSGTATLTVTAA